MHVRDSLTSLRHGTYESTLCALYRYVARIALRVSGTITENISRGDRPADINARREPEPRRACVVTEETRRRPFEANFLRSCPLRSTRKSLASVSKALADLRAIGNDAFCIGEVLIY